MQGRNLRLTPVQRQRRSREWWESPETAVHELPLHCEPGLQKSRSRTIPMPRRVSAPLLQAYGLGSLGRKALRFSFLSLFEYRARTGFVFPPVPQFLIALV